jgi:uncharacterized protein (TIGR02246 family)
MFDARSEEDSVRDLYEQLLKAWNERSAEDFAGLFTNDGAMIGFDGSQAAGRDEVEGHLRPIFEDHPTGSYVAKIRGVRFLGPENVMLRAIVGMVPPGQHDLNPDVNALQTLVAEHDENAECGWRIVLFQNTAAQYHGRPELVEQHTAELRGQLGTGTTLT